ncbi:MAG: hypothetical protein JSU63_17985 [Phycisphaerales bacterium]|nr:MAG: hypothetical protein JSU63_17985 [Phycisphaerales bacterium]
MTAKAGSVGTGVQLSLVPVRLAQGWTAQVLVKTDGIAEGPDIPSVLPTADQWKLLLDSLIAEPSAMDAYEVLKYSATAEIVRVRFAWEARDCSDSSGSDAGLRQSVDAVCKRSRVVGFRQRASVMWRQSRARVSLNRTVTLLQAGISTALPLALLERRAPSPEAWFITAFVPGLVDLDHIALALLPGMEAQNVRRAKDALIEATAGLFQKMEQHKLHHRDMKASNILISGWDDPKEPVRARVIDLEGLRRRRAWTRRKRWQPLYRLAASLLGYDSVTRSDHARLLIAYLKQCGLSIDSWKQQYRLLSGRAADYTRRAKRRKSHKLDGYTDDT